MCVSEANQDRGPAQRDKGGGLERAGRCWLVQLLASSVIDEAQDVNFVVDSWLIRVVN